MCGTKFYSIQITQDARDCAARLGDNEKPALAYRSGHEAVTEGGKKLPLISRTSFWQG